MEFNFLQLQEVPYTDYSILVTVLGEREWES